MELLWTTGEIRPAVRSVEKLRVRDLAADIRQLTIMEEKRMGPTEAKSRKRWMKDENKEI